MTKGLIWAKAEDLARTRGRVLFLYHQILQSFDSPKMSHNLAAWLTMKAEVRTIFMEGSDERSIHVFFKT
ncbi:hypothetical protein GIB67_019993 [Kingdonia uniflora]|uniref:LYR motif containing domain-containing protein n=1 Tax=Kingdonia uniflora TaxID=39325 RepID=A0A7J7MKT7_9MAGN|nr:hypothetical protein GIB67_019993 [Kingdonia uniflora]